MKFTRNQIIIIAAAFILVVAGYFLLTSATQKPAPVATSTLSVWGTDPQSTGNDLIALYMGAHPNVTVTYTQIDASGYQAKLLAALAAGTGPDVFEISNRELPIWKSVLAPMPTSSYFSAQFDIGKMQSYFPPTVMTDFTDNGSIYGLPLSIDTMAMVYNQDYFDSAGIALPPKTWDDFDADVLKLKQTDAQGNIVRAAAAIGGTRASIANADDLLYLLMLQNGTQMVDADHLDATFLNAVSSSSSPGISAMKFYLQFSDPTSPYYTWNDGMGDAVQSFVQGKTAILFAYHSELADIKQKAPFLNFAVAPMPQPTGATIAVNYPDYQGLVAAKKGNVTYAWDFILYLTAYAQGESTYVKDMAVPAAQRLVLATQESDPTSLSVFATQALSAQSWYEADDQKIDALFDTALENAISGALTPDGALLNAQEAVSQLMYTDQ